MPIQRFADQLFKKGELNKYMELLVNSFNRKTINGLMCRELVSVGWDGRLFDCDFNQMLDLDLGAAVQSGVSSIWTIENFDDLLGEPIKTGSHCFGCTAGAGSSCGGAVV